jgi:hypothetical protein
MSSTVYGSHANDHTSRTQLDRLLGPQNVSMTLKALGKCAELPGHCLFGLLLFVHALAELPRQYPLDGDRLDFLSNSVFRESYQMLNQCGPLFAMFLGIRSKTIRGFLST